MVKQIALFMLFAVLVQGNLTGQKGGESTYNFLGLTSSARVAALGGKNVAIMDDDINLVFHNPSLLTPGMNMDLNLNYVNYFAGVNFGYASYAFTLEKAGNFAAGIHHINYGQFDRTNEYGVAEGTFRASEYAINLVYSRSFLNPSLNFGVNLKPIFSSLEQYTSFGLALDVGGTYHNVNTNTTVGLVFKNMGVQLTSYTGTREKLPFEIQAGISQRLAHAPFRFGATFQNLERWDLTYVKKEEDLFNTPADQNQRSRLDIFGDKLMRHMVFGMEFLPGKNFHIDVGYNYKRRKEMKMNVRPGLVGLSMGFGFRISKFHFAYGRSAYHIAGGTNHFSLTTSLSGFYRKKKGE